MTLDCSLCGKHLVNLKVTDPKADVTYKFVAHCPCGDQSFIQEIKGLFAVARTDECRVTDVKQIGDIFHIETA